MAEQKQQTAAPVQVSRKVVLIARTVLAVIVVIWIAGIFYFHSQMKATEQEILKLRQRRQQEEELQRREAIYRRAAMQQTAVQNGVQNAVDALK